MDLSTAILSIVIIALLAGLVYSLFLNQHLKHQLQLANQAPKPQNQTQLKLTAYERLALFAERNKINNLITKLFNSGYSAYDMQQAMVAHVKEEYEYNLSQQLYVQPQLWEAVTKLKEQTIYIINQVTAAMPPNATALDLNKHLIELINANPNVTMNNVVLDALQFETKNLINN